jgi:predicted dehydrogenase
VSGRLGIGVIGVGYWGVNIVRNFSKVPNCRLVAVADINETHLLRICSQYPGVITSRCAMELIGLPDVDAVAIVTPASTHFDLCRRALTAGKHVLVEKPLATSSSEALELADLAESRDRKLMLDHTFLFCGAVQAMKRMVESGELGDVFYYHSVRGNLGKFQKDVNVLWDLGPHDFSIMSYIVPKQPTAVSAIGIAPISTDGWKRESVANVTVHFDGSTIGHITLSWLSPVKIRQTYLGCTKKMVLYDHLDEASQVKVYEKAVVARAAPSGSVDFIHFSGDAWVPDIDRTEPLEAVCKHFVDSIMTGSEPLTNGRMSALTVRLLEAAQMSMEQGGRCIEL